jgi:hypothetical protein
MSPSDDLEETNVVTILPAHCGTVFPTQRMLSQGGSSVDQRNFRPEALNWDLEDKDLVWTSATSRPRAFE